MPPIKFGVLAADPESIAEKHVYPHRWIRELTTASTERLLIAPRSGHIDLMIDLLDCMQGPFGMLYVLIVPRCDHERGRYQCESPREKWQLIEFLEEFRDYFENDGRHHLWISGQSDQSQLIYDNHNVIYAYGPLQEFESSLRKAGLTRGQFTRPAPHVHAYSAEFDRDEDRIFTAYNWKQFPVVEDFDDP